MKIEAKRQLGHERERERERKGAEKNTARNKYKTRKLRKGREKGWLKLTVQQDLRRVDNITVPINSY